MPVRGAALGGVAQSPGSSSSRLTATAPTDGAARRWRAGRPRAPLRTRSSPALRRIAGDPGVRVLHVVDRVVLRLAAGQLEVEVERGVVAALEQEPARGVHPDVVEQVVERHDRARALRHLHALAALGEVDELHDQRSRAVRVAAERLPGDPHPLDVAVVVGAPDGDHPVVAARELVGVVGDVHREVGELAGRAAQHAVLVVAVRRWCAARCALGLVDPVEPLERGLDPPACSSCSRE